MRNNVVKNAVDWFDSIHWDEIGLANKPKNEKISIQEPEQQCRVLPLPQNESSQTEYQRIRAHRERKFRLDVFRVKVLRNVIRLCYWPNSTWINDDDSVEELESLVDHALNIHGFNLDIALDYYRSLLPEIKDTRCKCGYVKPFCVCDFSYGRIN